MSHDLGFFSVKQGATTSEIRAAYLNSREGKEVSWPKTQAFVDFVAALEGEYPPLNTYSDEDLDNCPWSGDFEKGNGYLIVSMAFSRISEVGNFIWGLLERHPLIVFDPQTDRAYLGNEQLPEIY